MTVIKLPVKYKRPRAISAKEMYASPEPSDLMVWEICPYLRSSLGGEYDFTCQGCPKWECDEHFGLISRGCRVMAEEACKVMMAVQRREAGQ